MAKITIVDRGRNNDHRSVDRGRNNDRIIGNNVKNTDQTIKTGVGMEVSLQRSSSTKSSPPAPNLKLEKQFF